MDSSGHGGQANVFSFLLDGHSYCFRSLRPLTEAKISKKEINKSMLLLSAAWNKGLRSPPDVHAALGPDITRRRI